jgi:chemotaxis protein CheX
MSATQQAQIPDTKLVTPFVASARAVFNTAVGMEITIDRPFYRPDYVGNYVVTSIVGFAGDVQGSMALGFPGELAKKVVAAIAQAEVETNDPVFADAVSELASMIAGGAKKALGANAYLTVPNVIVSAGHHIARSRIHACVVIPCTVSAGDFMIEIDMKRSQS